MDPDIIIFIAPQRTIEKLNFMLERQDFYETLGKTVNFYVKKRDVM